MRKRARKKRKNPGYRIGDFPDFSDLFELIFGDLWAVQTRIVEVSIPAGMFRKLMMLCHPDKHANSELSHEVTRWLIEQRSKHDKIEN